MKHLTHSGQYAGYPICGAGLGARTGQDVHAVYAPVDNDEFRKDICPDCLKMYADSYLDDDGKLDEGAPDWVRILLGVDDHE